MKNKEAEMKKIAVLFPGIGYHCDKPLLYYSRRLAQNAGYDIFPITYSFKKSGLKGDPEKIRKAAEELMKQTEKALRDLSLEEYEDILFISKSLGTAMAARYAFEHDLDVRHILFTPLELTFEYPVKNSIAFSGSADLWADTELIRKLCGKSDIPLTVADGANHSLETGDVLRNIDILKEVTEQVRNFIS